MEPEVQPPPPPKPPSSPAAPGSARAWGVSAAVVVLGGLALYLARDGLARMIEPWPGLEPPPPPVAPPPPPPPPPPPEEPAGPQLTRAEVEALLAPLPEKVLALVEEGRAELPDYGDIDSDDATRRDRALRFYQNWGRTWQNRVDQLEKEAPPPDECAVHADLEPTCLMLTDAFAILRTVPTATRTDDAAGFLDQAFETVDFFLNPPPPPEEEVPADEEGAPGEDAVPDNP